MRYFKFIAGTPYDGTESEELFAYPDTVSNKELDTDCEDWGVRHCEGFEYLATGWSSEENEEDEEELKEDFWDDCYWTWEEIIEEDYNKITELE